MNTLVALGTGAAWLYSTVALAAPALFPEGSARPFYETVAVVITLILLGQGIEASARRRTAEALRALFDLAPETSERLDGGKVETVPVAAISPGDLVLVRPGARVPLDGRVTSGESDLNESMLTGGSAPALRVPGDEVVGGTINGTGALTVEVTRVGADTLLARIGAMVRRAQATKPPIQRTIGGGEREPSACARTRPRHLAARGRSSHGGSSAASPLSVLARDHPRTARAVAAFSGGRHLDGCDRRPFLS